MNAYDVYTGQPVPRQKSPLEEGVWLMPANTTDLEPPNFNPEIKTCSFVDGKWVLADIPAPAKEPEEPETVDLAPSNPPQTTSPDPDYVPDYKSKRMDEYGDTYAQLQFITENGLKAWQTKVTKIKAKFPKP